MQVMYTVSLVLMATVMGVAVMNVIMAFDGKALKKGWVLAMSMAIVVAGMLFISATQMPRLKGTSYRELYPEAFNEGYFEGLEKERFSWVIKSIEEEEARKNQPSLPTIDEMETWFSMINGITYDSTTSTITIVDGNGDTYQLIAEAYEGGELG